MSKNPKRMVINDTLQALNRLAVNMMTGRSTLGALVGGRNAQSLDVGNRNLDSECGYIEGEPTLQQYRMMYDQEGIATRIVEVYPDECWAVYPDLYETEKRKKTRFERQWEELQFEHNVWHYLHRLDGMAGIGQYGIMYLGMDDGGKPSSRVPGLDENGKRTKKVGNKEVKLLYIRTFSQEQVRVKEYQNNPKNPRYGQPQVYTVKMSSLDDASVNNDVPTSLVDVDIHWSRIIHFADNCKSSEVFGTPRLRNLHRRVYDIRKILGGSGEMFYKGGFPGISFEAYPEVSDDADIDMSGLKKEIDAYADGLQRYMRLIGMSAKSLAPQVADPKSHLDEQYRYISAATGVPIPILLGSTAGQLASDQETQRWNKRLGRRQQYTIEPKLVNPTVRRFIDCGITDEPSEGRWVTYWRDLNALSDKDKADTALKKAQAILQYVTSKAYLLLKPRMFMTEVMQMSDKVVDAIVAEHGGEEAMLAAMEDAAAAELAPAGPAGNTPNSTNTKPSAKTGAAGRTNGLGRPAKNKTSSRNGGNAT